MFLTLSSKLRTIQIEIIVQAFTVHCGVSFDSDLMWYNFDTAGPRTNATRNSPATAIPWSIETAKVRLSDADRLRFSFLYKFIIAITPVTFIVVSLRPRVL